VRETSRKNPEKNSSSVTQIEQVVAERNVKIGAGYEL